MEWPSSQGYKKAYELTELVAQRQKELIEAEFESTPTSKFYRYDFEDKAFQLRLADDKWVGISLTTKRAKKYQSTLFEVILKLWESEKYSVEFVPEVAIIPISKILEESGSVLNEKLSQEWFKNTLRHLKEKISNIKKLSFYLNIDRTKTKDGKFTSNITFQLFDPLNDPREWE